MPSERGSDGIFYSGVLILTARSVQSSNSAALHCSKRSKLPNEAAHWAMQSSMRR
ncbi:TPA: hypothetical protein WIT34_000974 [Neisseria meningitidis]|jgi:hypothetical protein|uniref:hypothetical protein n=1 Tax=Neisseria TaxID=482 RepID=UPI0015D5423F|nr:MULTISPECIES: hypothetical protein [Neisseria]